jgi:deoxyribose-phosphate aldolase
LCCCKYLDKKSASEIRQRYSREQELTAKTELALGKQQILCRFCSSFARRLLVACSSFVDSVCSSFVDSVCSSFVDSVCSLWRLAVLWQNSAPHKNSAREQGRQIARDVLNSLCLRFASFHFISLHFASFRSPSPISIIQSFFAMPSTPLPTPLAAPLTTAQIQLAAMIDHTLLKPESTTKQVAALCDEALQYSFASVCVNPTHVDFAAARLKGSPVKVCTVIGFPLGANETSTKVFETDLAIKRGAREVDMVINVGALKAGDHQLVRQDIVSVVEAALRNNAIAKVIVETALLSEDEKIAICRIVTDAGAAFIKTSTGFSTGGATLDDIRLMRTHCGKDVQIKASGGIRDLAFAQSLIAAGATRLGTSSGAALVQALAQAGSGAGSGADSGADSGAPVQAVSGDAY